MPYYLRNENVEAIHFTGTDDSFLEVQEWLKEHDHYFEARVSINENFFVTSDSRGENEVFSGSWFVEGSDGTLIVLDDDAFQSLFEHRSA